MFNTLAYTKKLEDIGYNREQAETHIEVIAEVLEGEMISKTDLIHTESKLKDEIRGLRSETQEVRIELKSEIHDVRTELKKEIHELKLNTNNKFQKLENKINELGKDLTIRLGSIVVIAITVSITLLGFLSK